MPRTEFIWVAADLDEAVETVRGFPELVSEKQVVEGNFAFVFAGVRGNPTSISVEIGADSSDDHPTVIDVEQARWSDVPEKAQMVFDLLARRTTWELASRFDRDDRPLVHRPRLA